ncbi:type IV pilus modification protein PilV [Thioalkalivibrio sp.]|uniref:type IV pilus modification protein PilV n=1 Tax=Thioalkalivibrio sp. TaxID=2093813 RepID=UPI0012D644F4|nr:type IV pilus modification protein PilV [Thioalkalivibrio sp.]TVP81515.1 MAG: type IV pilus modification protein PilV [Thioalkalivibrio sp.]
MSLRHSVTAARVQGATRADRPRAPAIGSTRAAVQPAGASGFTLLEVLIALLVLSVGTLGCVALQLNALQATHSAYQRSLASLIAADAGERLWQGLGDGQIDTAWLSDWRQRRSCETGEGHVCLPELDVTIEGSALSRVITVSWAETRFEDAVDGRSQLGYVIELLPERLP